MISGFGSAEVLITTTTVSTAVSEIEFTSGITSTYKEYVFKLHNIFDRENILGCMFEYKINTKCHYSRISHISKLLFRGDDYVIEGVFHFLFVGKLQRKVKVLSFVDILLL